MKVVSIRYFLLYLGKQCAQSKKCYYCWSVRTSHKAWIIPGTPNIKVSIILIQKCLVAPTCINAATGGRKIERIIFTIFILLLLNKKIVSRVVTYYWLHNDCYSGGLRRCIHINFRFLSGRWIVGAAFQPRISSALPVRIAAEKPLPQNSQQHSRCFDF